MIWSAGVKGPDVLSRLDGLETNRISQLVVTPTLQTTRNPDIFAIGDCAACPQPGGAGDVPPRAQAAHQEASHLVNQLPRRLRGEPLKPYVYRDFGSLVSLGRFSTVGNLRGFLVGKNFFIEGYFARLMYRSLYILHEAALHGVTNVILSTIGRTLSPTQCARGEASLEPIREHEDLRAKMMTATQDHRHLVTMRFE